MVSKATYKIIIDYLKDTHGVVPTQEQFDQIVNKLELAEYIKHEVAIEWEWTIKLTSTCFSCDQDGAESWVMDQIGELFTVEIKDSNWSSSWQVVE